MGLLLWVCEIILLCKLGCDCSYGKQRAPYVLLSQKIILILLF